MEILKQLKFKNYLTCLQSSRGNKGKVNECADRLRVIIQFGIQRENVLEKIWKQPQTCRKVLKALNLSNWNFRQTG